MLTVPTIELLKEICIQSNPIAHGAVVWCLLDFVRSDLITRRAARFRALEVNRTLREAGFLLGAFR